MKRSAILRLLGANIRKARLQAGMTQEGLAETVGIHWKTLGYIESGKRDFGVSILIKIVFQLNISGPDLLHGMTGEENDSIATIIKATARKRKPRPTSCGL